MTQVAQFPTSITTQLFDAVARLSTTLTADIDDSTETIPVASVTKFPATGFITIDNETIYYASISSLNLICTSGRGYDGIAASHLSGAAVKYSITATGSNRFKVELIAVQTYLGISGSTSSNYVDLTHNQTKAGVLTLSSNPVSPTGTGITPIDGWIATGTFTYNAATTITVASGAASIYQKGDKLRFKQGAGYKYFYIITVADTLLTVTGGTDYTVATPTAITDTYYSHIENPLGFPTWFNYLPTITWTAGTAPINPVGNNNVFRISGNFCTVNIMRYAYTAGATVTVAVVPLPVAGALALAAYGLINIGNTPNPTTAYSDTANINLTCTSVSADKISVIANYPI